MSHHRQNVTDSDGYDETDAAGTSKHHRSRRGPLAHASTTKEDYDHDDRKEETRNRSRSNDYSRSRTRSRSRERDGRYRDSADDSARKDRGNRYDDYDAEEGDNLPPSTFQTKHVHAKHTFKVSLSARSSHDPAPNGNRHFGSSDSTGFSGAAAATGKTTNISNKSSSTASAPEEVRRNFNHHQNNNNNNNNNKVGGYKGKNFNPNYKSAHVHNQPRHHHFNNNNNNNNHVGGNFKQPRPYVKAVTPELAELQSFYNEEKVSKMDIARQQRKKIQGGIEKIFDILPKGPEFISFMKDAIKAGVVRITLCDISNSNDYRHHEILNGAIPFVTSKLPIPVKVFKENRPAETPGAYSCALLMDWASTFPQINKDDEEEDSLVNLATKYGIHVLDKEDFKEFEDVVAVANLEENSSAAAAAPDTNADDKDEAAEEEEEGQHNSNQQD